MWLIKNQSDKIIKIRVFSLRKGDNRQQVDKPEFNTTHLINQKIC